MDRFSEQSVSDLARSFARCSRCNRDEDGYPDIDLEPFDGPLIEEPFEVDTPDQSLCPLARRIIEAAETVGEILDGVRAHQVRCAECRGVVLISSQIRKVAA